MGKIGQIAPVVTCNHILDNLDQMFLKNLASEHGRYVSSDVLISEQPVSLLYIPTDELI
jgi:hypothetical protein